MSLKMEIAETLARELGKQGVFNLRLLELLTLNGCITADQAEMMMSKLDINEEISATYAGFFKKAEAAAGES